MFRVYILNKELNASTFTVFNQDGVGVEYAFKGGNVVNHTPASFMTENPYFQNVLETSEYFKNGIVKFDAATAKAVAEENRIAAERKAKEAVVETPVEDVVAEDAEDVDEEGGIIAEPSVKTVQEAITYCADKFGIAVKTSAQAKKLALENGVDFINLKVGRK